MVFQQNFMYFFVSDTTGLTTDLKFFAVSYILPAVVVVDSFDTPHHHRLEISRYKLAGFCHRPVS